METTTTELAPNPKEQANPLADLFFTYTFGMFKKGYQKTLEVADLYNPLREDRSKRLGDRLQRNWDAHRDKARLNGQTPSLGRVLVQTFWPEYLVLGFILTALDLVLRISQPIFLGNLLEYYRPDADMSKRDALINAGVIVAINAGNAILVNQYIFRAFHYGMRVRAAVCSLIYRKALTLSRSALSETTSGKVVNLLSNDVSRFDVVSVFIHHMWVGPVSTCIIMYFLWRVAGLAGFIGIIPVFLVVPIQSYTGKLASKFRRETAYKTDERVRLMDEIINGIQVIKMYAWEKPFEKLIRISRVKELKKVTKLSYVRALFMTFNLFTTRVALFCSLLTVVLAGQPITATTVFVFMLYFNILSQNMSSMFVRGIAEVAEMFVAIARLQEFLLNEEFEDTSRTTNNNDVKTNENVAVHMTNLTAKWGSANSENVLTNVNITVRNGNLVSIIGPVGSGKSSLLQTLLGELDVIAGDLVINGKLAYASQEPWVFASSIRQNILFGEAYSKKRYNDVVKACSLDKDFKQFEDGDKTIVGDRGASLSGGQKARINLARTVYREAEIYLLDDPLSAVDVHVAKHIFRECIEGLLRNKTRILVTHQLHHLKGTEHIVILNDGHVESQGSYRNLSNNHDVYYARLLSQDEEPEAEEIQERNTISKQISRSKSLSMSVSSVHSDLSTHNDLDDDKPSNNFEESSKGKIRGSLFMQYLSAGGNYCFVATVLMLYILTQLAASGVDFFVSFWTNIEEYRNAEHLLNNTKTQEIVIEYQAFSTYTCLYIYGGLIASLALIALVRSMLFYKLAMISSQKLHDNMFRSIVYTTMRFFDTNPSGRILNRFSKDIGAIDELLPKSVLDAAQILLLMVGSLVLVALVNPMLLIPLAVISVFFYGIRIVFLKSSKNIKRLEGMMRSPVFTHLNASIQGLTTIRAFGAQEILTDEFDKHQDLHTSAWFMYIAASSAFGFYLDALCFIFIAIVTFSFLVLQEDTLGGQVGLAITQASTLTGFVQWGMRQSAEVTNQLMSVERVLEYTGLEEEKQPLVANHPPPDWPQHGKVQFKRMGLRYAPEMNLVLKNLNIIIRPREKIGVVGRTGAGKSSMISALFRLAFIEGEIEIDGVDTETITLQELRSKISIIPQDPVLFSGTLRYNLDPFDEYPDEVLYRALEGVELKDSANIINRLENRVMDRGANYSVGQRQLVCLARAIIRKNKILMLDEATANVDPHTDALIQKTIREKFAECTVLTVAHRLNTIMDSDKVMVMSHGEIMEFNHPNELLANPHGIFYEMVHSSGMHMAEQLRKIARTSYNMRNQSDK